MVICSEVILTHHCIQVSDISQCCTTYFSKENCVTGDRFLSETCEVYGFGSNSSTQLAMGPREKFQTASLASHMADVQVVSKM